MIVYHFTRAEHGISNIANQRIKVAELDKLNDPFEFSVYETTPETESIFDRVFKKLADRTGIICFSEHWHDPMMWAHYAEDHKGLCLAFEIDRSLLERVNYEDQRLELPDDPTNPASWTEVHMNKILYTKYKVWDYEAEWRLALKYDLESKDLRGEGGLIFQHFCEKMKLREVILGMRTMITEHQIVDAIKNYPEQILIRRAARSPKEYKVIEDNRP
jgi:hypothetical protein